MEEKVKQNSHTLLNILVLLAIFSLSGCPRHPNDISEAIKYVNESNRNFQKVKDQYPIDKTIRLSRILLNTKIKDIQNPNLDLLTRLEKKGIGEQTLAFLANPWKRADLLGEFLELFFKDEDRKKEKIQRVLQFRESILRLYGGKNTPFLSSHFFKNTAPKEHPNAFYASHAIWPSGLRISQLLLKAIPEGSLTDKQIKVLKTT